MQSIGHPLIHSHSVDWFSALDAAFARDPLIDELGFIVDDLSDDDDDDSDAVVARPASERLLLVEHKLGVPFAALAPLSLYAMQLLRSAPADDDRSLLSASRAILIVSADQSAAWHVRKRLLLKALSLESVDGELAFVALLLTKHPKSGEAWSHRRWLVQLRRGRLGVPDTPAWLAAEAALCSRVADAYPRCYYAWSYRLALFMAAIDAQTRERLLETVHAELHRLGDFVRRHVSDGSAYNMRRALLRRVALECGASLLTQALLCVEWALTRHIIDFYPGHASVWHHRRAVADLWHSLWPLQDAAAPGVGGDKGVAADRLVADAVFGRAVRAPAVALAAPSSFLAAAATEMPHVAAQALVLACELGELCGESGAALAPSASAAGAALPVSLEGELRFAARHAQDAYVERFSNQREGALGYALFLLLLTKRSVVHSVRWRHDMLRSAGFDDATVGSVDNKLDVFHR
jgi:protein prenyltransferase alpha subunit repeat containing protein 1